MAHRNRFWIDTLVDATLGAGGQELQSLMTNITSAESRRGLTMVRTLIQLDVAYAVHDAGEGSQHVSLGIGITSQEAFSAGIVSDPQTVTDHPVGGWCFRSRYRVFGFAADQPAIHLVRIEKDIRAMRKLNNGEMYLVISSAFIEGAAASTRTMGIVRQLWLEG